MRPLLHTKVFCSCGRIQNASKSFPHVFSVLYFAILFEICTALLNEGDNPTNLKDQIEGLVDVGFGSSHPRHAVGELPIHYALKVGTSEK